MWALPAPHTQIVITIDWEASKVMFPNKSGEVLGQVHESWIMNHERMSKISQCAICVAMRDTFWDIRPNFEIFRYILTINLSIWQFWVVQTLRTYFELSAHTPSIVRTYFELSRHFSQTGFHETMTQNLQGYLFRPYASAPLPLPISESGGNNEICLVGSNPLDYLHCKLPTLSPLCYSAMHTGEECSSALHIFTIVLLTPLHPTCVQHVAAIHSVAQSTVLQQQCTAVWR